MTSTRDPGPWVIVGFDGSQAARVAVPVAAAEAVLRGANLRIVQVVETAAGSAPGPGIPMGEPDAEVAETAAELARSTLPVDRIDVETVHGFALDELLARSVDAEMLVLGRGHPSPLGVLLGSVALGAASRAPCPVLVVGPAPPDAAGIVVVGVDGTEDSGAALEAAFSEAHLRRVQLVAIHTWHRFASAGPGDADSLSADPLGLERDETRTLRELVEPFRTRFPLVAVTEQLVEGAPARALVDSSAQAALLIVGTRGRGPIKGLLLGSVSQHVVAHARCPVLVARSRGESAAPTLTRAPYRA